MSELLALDQACHEKGKGGMPMNRDDTDAEEARRAYMRRWRLKTVERRQKTAEKAGFAGPLRP